jgi:hypothetical protein
MADCSTWGFAGTSVPLPDLLSTTGTLNCFMSGFTQTGNTITVSVCAAGTTTSLASISGGGNDGTLAAMTTGTFSISPGTTYVAVVTAVGQTPQVLYSFDSMSYGSTTFAGTCSLCVEDQPSGGDCDFNDAVVSISWTLNAG